MARYASSSTVLFVCVVVSLVTLMNAQDSAPPPPSPFLEAPLIATDIHPGNIVSEVWKFFRGIPNAFNKALGAIERTAMQPFEVAKDVLNAVRPDRSLPKLLHPPFNCKCRPTERTFSCMCCLNVSLPFFDVRQRVCKNVTLDPGNLSFGVNEIVNGKSFVNLVFTVPIIGGHGGKESRAMGPVVVHEGSTSTTPGEELTSSTTEENSASSSTTTTTR